VALLVPLEVGDERQDLGAPGRKLVAQFVDVFSRTLVNQLGTVDQSGCPPSRARFTATVFPIPCAAPVMTATVPSKLRRATGRRRRSTDCDSPMLSIL
jgi:hypothetical protein